MFAGFSSPAGGTKGAFWRVPHSAAHDRREAETGLKFTPAWISRPP